MLDMIPKYLSAVDVLALSCLKAAGSGVVNIAMACGKPIITSGL